MKLLWMKFFPADWFRDTKCLSFRAKGCWIDLIGILWDASPRGTKTVDLAGWAEELGKPIGEVKRAFAELSKRGVCDIVTLGNDEVTVMSRRQVREQKVYEQGRLRVQRFRKRKSNAIVTDKTSDLRLQTIDLREEKRPLRAAVIVDEVWLADLGKNPAYAQINLAIEMGKMDAWLGLPKNAKRRKTRSFVLNWLNKVEAPMTTNGAQPVSIPKAFRKLEAPRMEGTPMPADIRELIAQAGKGKGRPA